MKKILLFFFFLQFINIYCELPSLIKRLQKKNFNYQTVINKKEFQVNEKISVTNSVSKENYSFSGAHIILYIAPRGEGQKNTLFPNDFKNNVKKNNQFYKGKTKLQEIEINDKTKVKGIFYTTNINVGNQEGLFDLYTFFLNSTRGYTEHINITSFRVIKKSKIVFLYYFFWTLLILLIIALVIKTKFSSSLLYLLCPIFLVFKNQKYTQQQKKIKNLVKKLSFLLLGYGLFLLTLFVSKMIFVLCIFFISILVYILVKQKKNFLYFLLIFLSCQFFISLFLQQYGESNFLKNQVLYFPFEVLMTVFFPVIKLLYFFQQREFTTFFFNTEQKLKIFISTIPIIFFLSKNLFLRMRFFLKKKV